MFNPLTPGELVAAMGRAARDTARSADPADGFIRAQLMSVYSASRHLAVELSPAFDQELRSFGSAVARALEPAGDTRMAAVAEELADLTDPRRMGDLVCELLDHLREDPSPDAARRRSALRSALAVLADREVELFSEVIEGAP